MTGQWGDWQPAAPPTENEPTENEPTENEPTENERYEAHDEQQPVSEADQQPESEPEDNSDPAVSAVHALRQRLTELEELPIEEHPARYEQLHAELTAALGRIDGA